MMPSASRATAMALLAAFALVIAPAAAVVCAEMPEGCQRCPMPPPPGDCAMGGGHGMAATAEGAGVKARQAPMECCLQPGAPTPALPDAAAPPASPQLPTAAPSGLLVAPAPSLAARPAALPLAADRAPPDLLALHSTLLI